MAAATTCAAQLIRPGSRFAQEPGNEAPTDLLDRRAAIAAPGIPAVAGLAGNPSFSHKLPVRPPSQAQLVQFDDHGQAVHSTRPRARESEPGDDRARGTEPGDDRGGDHAGEIEPGDDSSGHGDGSGPRRGR